MKAWLVLALVALIACTADARKRAPRMAVSKSQKYLNPLFYEVTDKPLFEHSPIFSKRPDELAVPTFSVLRRFGDDDPKVYKSRRCLFIHGLLGDKANLAGSKYDYWGSPLASESLFRKVSCYKIWYLRYPTMHIPDGWANPEMQKVIVAMIERFQYDPCNPSATKIFAHSAGNLYIAGAIENNMFKYNNGECMYGPRERLWEPVPAGKGRYKRPKSIGLKDGVDKNGKKHCAGPWFYSVMGPWQGTKTADNQYKLCSKSSHPVKAWIADNILKMCASPYRVRCKKNLGCQLFGSGHLNMEPVRRLQYTKWEAVENMDNPRKLPAYLLKTKLEPAASAYPKRGGSLTFFDWGYVACSTALSELKSGVIAHTGYDHAYGAMCGRVSFSKSWMPNKGWVYPLVSWLAKPSSVGEKNDGVVSLPSCTGSDIGVRRDWSTDYRAEGVRRRYYQANVNHFDGAGRSTKINCNKKGENCPTEWYVEMSKNQLTRSKIPKGKWDARCVPAMQLEHASYVNGDSPFLPRLRGPVKMKTPSS